MTKVNITMNGRAIQADAGSTILETAKAAGVDIPTLCHHPALANIGACRMCLVEIAKQPLLQPACTYPVFEGLVVETESPRVMEMRKFVLEMLFSERNHYCMYCEMSGDCELQKQGYRHGLDHWTYPSPNAAYEVDGTRKYFLMDHNRCILCRRCIRACGDLVANNTLGLKFRGAKTMICADMDVAFGESSCVSCGTCLQVCPTGALVDRKSAYMGRNCQVEKTPSACTFCAVGCRTQAVTRAGSVLRVEGDWEGHNGGVLCVAGRFEPLFDSRERVASPMMRKNGKLAPVTLAEALAATAKQLKAAGKKVKAVTTGQALSETMQAFVQLFKNKVGGAVAALEPALPALPQGATLKDLDGADCVLVVGADPLADHRVVGYRIKKARAKDAQVLLVADGENEFAACATQTFAAAKLDEAVKLCQAAKAPVVVYGAGVGAAEAKKLAALKDKAKFMPLFPAANGKEAEALGLKNDLNANGAELAFLLAQEAAPQADAVKSLRQAKCLVVQACYHGPATEAADIVLPAPLWSERQGTFSNLEGTKMTVAPAVQPPTGLIAEEEMLNRLAGLL